MKNVVILNEMHHLFPEQVNILNESFPNWEKLLVPESGWNIQQMDKVHLQIQEMGEEVTLVFASPVPYLIKQTIISSLVIGLPETVLIIY